MIMPHNINWCFITWTGNEHAYQSVYPNTRLFVIMTELLLFTYTRSRVPTIYLTEILVVDSGSVVVVGGFLVCKGSKGCKLH